MNETKENETKPLTAGLRLEHNEASAVQLVLSGEWRKESDRSASSRALGEMRTIKGIRKIVIVGGEIQSWDSILPSFLRVVDAYAAEIQAEIELQELPDGARRLWELSRLAPELPAQSVVREQGFVARLGNVALYARDEFRDALKFLGELFQALRALLRGRANCRRSDFMVALQECGPEALPIITLISLLVGMILAFLGSVQLKLFGVEIFVANAVAIGMLREMGALMTGILLAGRTGAAFAARLGTMQVNEEIDALRTLGFPPMEFLVLPRVLALIIALPLLAIYSGLVGILGGAIVGVTMLDLSPVQYYLQTISSVTPKAIFSGLIKASVFGVLVAFSGCMQGLRCERSASAVGRATTAAVVNAIVYIVVADALISIIYVLIHF
ncbi:MAG: ABC transporter permease [Kiritimatiellae bacterium]|nr:ABC transporter permease [Kiritimatiellia bacterium]